LDFSLKMGDLEAEVTQIMLELVELEDLFNHSPVGGDLNELE
jgi:hypothetical protein